jgi:hypothetical protein
MAILFVTALCKCENEFEKKKHINKILKNSFNSHFDNIFCL